MGGFTLAALVLAVASAAICRSVTRDRMGDDVSPVLVTVLAILASFFIGMLAMRAWWLNELAVRGLGEYVSDEKVLSGHSWAWTQSAHGAQEAPHD